jgi:tRNA threonylcarbamoyladenosine biosynthesis protein TsaE
MIWARTKSVDDTRALAAEIAQLSGPGDILLLAGDLGAGKTAFTQGFGAALGVTSPITSPTFTLMRTYEGRHRIHHFDVYRLDQLQEVVDLGMWEMLDDGAIVLVEWGDVVAPALPADFLEVRLELTAADDERMLRLRPVGPKWCARQGGLQRAIERWAAEVPR